MRADRQGFSLLEAIVVLSLLLLVAAISLPLLVNSSTFARARADAYDLSGKLTLAKFRAANELTGYRVRADLNNNSYQLERRCSSSDILRGLCTAGQYIPEGPVSTFRSSIIYADQNDLSGYTSTPANGEQASPPRQSLEIIFNSRGIPVDAVGRPFANNAIYLRNTNKDSFAVTVSLAGLIEVWRYLPDGSWAQPQ